MNVWLGPKYASVVLVKICYKLEILLSIVCIEVSTPPPPLKNTTPLFFGKPLLILQTVQAPPPEAILPYIMVFAFLMLYT